MHDFDRRTMVFMVGAGVLAAAGHTARATAAPPRPNPSTGRVPPPIGVLSRLPGDGNQLALTIDDGASTQVVAAFANFCRDNGTRLTFFVNGANSSWTANAPALRPMVDAGQIQLGNHTWSHPDITRIGPAAVADQIRRNADFLRNTYGVDGTPYFRPPYARHTPDTDRIAADHGYTTIALWSGSIGDSTPISEAGMIAAAKASFQPQQIVVGHANLPTITRCFPQLLEIIGGRNLQTVTLNDVFG